MITTNMLINLLFLVILIIDLKRNDKSIIKKLYTNSKTQIITYTAITTIVTTFLVNVIVGNNFLKTLYETLGIFLNFDIGIESNNDYINLLIDIAKICSVITAGGVITSVFVEINEYIQEKRKSNEAINTVIYTDNEKGEELANVLNKADHRTIAIKENFDKYFNVPEQIVMFSNDQKSISFLSKHEKEINNDSEIKLLLNTYDSKILDEGDYKAYNLNEVMAKNFWLNNNPFIPFDKLKKNIAFIGLNDVGCQMLKTALLNNLFDVNQKITYYVWGEKEHFLQFDIPSLEKLTNDKVEYCGVSFLDKESIKKLNNSDIIIVSKTDNIGLECLLTRILGNNKKMYIYDENSSTIDSNKFKSHMSCPEIIHFGDLGEVFKESDPFYKTQEMNAKKSAYEYDLIYVQNKKNADINSISLKTLNDYWKTQSNYNKRSSIASSNYIYIREKVADKLQANKKLTDKEKGLILDELEHMRWCRYMLLDGFVYGKVTDKSKKIHKDLIPFNKLSKEEKSKDTQQNKQLKYKK